MQGYQFFLLEERIVNGLVHNVVSGFRIIRLSVLCRFKLCQVQPYRVCTTEHGVHVASLLLLSRYEEFPQAFLGRRAEKGCLIIIISNN